MFFCTATSSSHHGSGFESLENAARRPHPFPKFQNSSIWSCFQRKSCWKTAQISLSDVQRIGPWLSLRPVSATKYPKRSRTIYRGTAAEKRAAWLHPRRAVSWRVMAPRSIVQEETRKPQSDPRRAALDDAASNWPEGDESKVNSTGLSRKVLFATAPFLHSAQLCIAAIEFRGTRPSVVCCVPSLEQQMKLPWRSWKVPNRFSNWRPHDAFPPLLREKRKQRQDPMSREAWRHSTRLTRHFRLAPQREAQTGRPLGRSSAGRHSASSPRLCATPAQLSQPAPRHDASQDVSLVMKLPRMTPSLKGWDILVSQKGMQWDRSIPTCRKSALVVFKPAAP